MSNTTGEIRKYELLLAEAKGRYANVNKNFVNNRNKMFALLSAELAIMTYLFSDLLNIFPQELYGRVIFVIACMGILVSVGILFVHYRSIFNWPTPTGAADREKILAMSDELDVLKYLEQDYRSAAGAASKILEKRAKIFNASMQLFAFSAIILLIIKIF